MDRGLPSSSSATHQLQAAAHLQVGEDIVDHSGAVAVNKVVGIVDSTRFDSVVVIAKCSTIRYLSSQVLCVYVLIVST